MTGHQSLREAQAAALTVDFVAAALYLRAGSLPGVVATLLPLSMAEGELPDRIRLMTAVGATLIRFLTGLPECCGAPELPAVCADTQLDVLIELVALFAELDWRI